jgi:hypothetical protein
MNARNSTGSDVVERAAVWDKPRSDRSSDAVLQRMKERDRVAEILSLTVSIRPSSAVALLRRMDVNPCLKLFLRFT